MTTLHASALILLLALSGSQAFLAAEKGRGVIIRIDDIQDYAQLPSFYESEKKVLEYHVAEKTPALLAIIASRFGTNQLLTEQVKDGLRIGVFTAGIHGWHHDPVANLTRTQQITEMRYAKNRLEAVLGIEILTFVPPFGKFNRDTIAALKANDLTVMSSSTSDGDIPREEDGILFIPRTVSTAEVDVQTDNWMPLTLESITEGIESSWESYGIAVVVIHPR